MSSSEEKTPTILRVGPGLLAVATVSPDKGATGETVPFKRWEEIESESQFLKQNKEMLELFHSRRGQGYDELLQEMEQWIEIIESNASLNGCFTGPGKEKDKVKGKNWLITSVLLTILTICEFIS